MRHGVIGERLDSCARLGNPGEGFRVNGDGGTVAGHGDDLGGGQPATADSNSLLCAHTLISHPRRGRRQGFMAQCV
ncbi:hypothetical protein GCM10009860_20010 [Microbacterium mitrae]